MQRFVLRRLAFMGIAAVSATMVVFGVSRLAGDPLLLYAKPGGYGQRPEQTQALKKKYGLDEPLVVQYFVWMRNLVQGDLGRSLLDDRPVAQVLKERISPTLKLALAAWLMATLVGVPVGVLSALKRGTVWDYMARGFALFGQALPAFWVGMMGIFLFAVKFDLVPSATLPSDAPLRTQISYIILPAVAAGWAPAAGYARLTRSAMLEVLDSEYIKLARSKGVGQWTVVWKHAFRNALIPPLTLSALVLAGFLNGVTVVEVVFAWPGIGRLAMDAVYNNDFPLLTGAVLGFAGIILFVMLLADIAYAYIDPRIRYR